MSYPLKILQKYWGYDNFRPLQEDIINTALSTTDVVALLPTGGGKSLCFQIPTMLKEGVCIVISPLIALMEDQVNNLQNKGIKATYLKSGTTQDELIRIFDNIRYGNYKFLYLSPERLESKFIQEKIKQLNVCLVAIDEAHCISQWGHDFRTSYRNIALLRKLHPEVSFIALTATATKKVITDITENLALKKPQVFKQSFHRKNLFYQVIHTEDKLYKLKQALQKINESAIVYVNTRAKTKQLADYLNNQGIKCSFYHGGMLWNEKQSYYNKWMDNTNKVMVATNAFGMGIDKKDVRLIIHYNLPNSIENFVQEAGRAGRDEKQAFSLILTNANDINLAQKIQEAQTPSITDIKKIYVQLFQYFQIAKGERIDHGLTFDLIDFCNTYGFSASKVYTTIKILENFGVLEYHTNYKAISSVKFLINANEIFKHINHNTKRKTLVQLLLRMYGGIFESEKNINEFVIAQNAQTTSWYIIKELEKLAQENIIEYNKANKSSLIFINVPREDEKTINPLKGIIKRQLHQKQKKLNTVISFVTEKNSCRNSFILNYFQETVFNKCKNCDICKKLTHVDNSEIKNAILDIIRLNNELSAKEICELLYYDNEKILINLQALLLKNKLKISKIKKYYTPTI